jgi:hypothetical protein
MKQTCSNNLKQHLKILKQEGNKLYNTVSNGDKPSWQDVMDYNTHLKFVKDLIRTEKAVYFNSLLTNRKKPV